MDKVPKDIRNLITDYYGQRKQFYELYDNDYINRNQIINCRIFEHINTVNGNEIKRYRIHIIMSNTPTQGSFRAYPSDGASYLTYEEAKKKQQEILFG